MFISLSSWRFLLVKILFPRKGVEKRYIDWHVFNLHSDFAVADLPFNCI